MSADEPASRPSFSWSRAAGQALVAGVLLGMVWAKVEFATEKPGYHAKRLESIATYVCVMGWGTVGLWAVLGLIPVVRRRAQWIAPALAAGTVVTGVIFFRIHAAGLVFVPWTDDKHLEAFRVGGWCGLTVTVFGFLLCRGLGATPLGVVWSRATGHSMVVGVALLVGLGASVVTARTVADPYRVSLPGPRESELPCNVVMLTIDTLRADHLKQYGYHRPVAERLERFGFTTFERCSSTANWTRPTTASILTGLYPSSHGAFEMNSRLSSRAETILEVTASQGAATGYFTANINASDVFGYAQGVETKLADPTRPDQPWGGTTFGQLVAAHSNLQDGMVLNRYVLGFLEGALADRFHLYVQYNDPHEPYRPPQSYVETYDPNYPGRIVDKPRRWFRVTDREQEHSEARYDGEIDRSVDAIVQVLELLEQHGVLDDTLVILTADHGEEFRDHGNWTHAKTSYQEMLHIPLLIRPPRAPGVSRVSEIVSQVDLYPTVLDYLDLPIPEQLPGRSLRPGIEGTTIASAERPVLSESHHSQTWSYQRSGFKLLVAEGGEIRELYQLAEDPRESNNLATKAEFASLVEELYREGLEMRERFAAQALDTSAQELDSEVTEELRALGYMDSH